jgi:1-acyl-sn-glycerol-3-phosphate acyltransferase
VTKRSDTQLPEERSACHFMQAFNRGYARVYHRLEVFAPCRLPSRGGGIVVCNHTSGLDPHLIQSCCPRLITWMMAQEYYELPVLRSVFKVLGVIPVTRSGRDTSATRAALRALADGQLLGIFPEGRIEKTRELLPFQTGVALMAIKREVPVYPVYLDGTQRNREMLPALLQPQRATIAFGEPVEFDRTDTSREGLERATEGIRNAVDALRVRSERMREQRGM